MGREAPGLFGPNDLSGNENLGDAPPSRAFPAGLAGMKSLRLLYLNRCGLATFPAFVAKLASISTLDLANNPGLGDAPEQEAFPAALGRAKSPHQQLSLVRCRLRAVPAFLGGLASLETLALCGNLALGQAPARRAFPEALAGMKSLRVLALSSCRLRAFPSFVCKLESLEVLDLSDSAFEVEDAAALDALLGGCTRLREVKLTKYARPWTERSLANVEMFKARLLARNPDAVVLFEFISPDEFFRRRR